MPRLWCSVLESLWYNELSLKVRKWIEGKTFIRGYICYSLFTSVVKAIRHEGERKQLVVCSLLRHLIDVWYLFSITVLCLQCFRKYKYQKECILVYISYFIFENGKTTSQRILQITKYSLQITKYSLVFSFSMFAFYFKI